MYDGMGDCAKKLYQSGGLSSLYRGWEATLLRDIPGSVGYFGGYEGIKRLLTPAGQNPDELNAFRTFIAGGFAGMVEDSSKVLNSYVRLFRNIKLGDCDSPGCVEIAVPNSSGRDIFWFDGCVSTFDERRGSIRLVQRCGPCHGSCLPRQCCVLSRCRSVAKVFNLDRYDLIVIVSNLF